MTPTDVTTAADLLGLFHRQIRLAGREDEPSPGIVQDSDGPVRRRYPQEPRTSYCMVECPSGLAAEPDVWIQRQVDFFTERGEKVEWKTYGYDEPVDLTERLSAAGFVGEDEEVLLLGRSADLVHDVVLPDGVSLRSVEAGDEATFRRIHALMSRVWGGVTDPDGITEEDYQASMTTSLQRELAADAGALEVVVVEEEATGAVLCAAWVRYTPGTAFASLWGGSTHPDWRRRGLYRATVVHRAGLALGRGYELIRVDTSPDSRPILTGLGLHAVTTTTPYVLDATPPAATAPPASGA